MTRGSAVAICLIGLASVLLAAGQQKPPARAIQKASAKAEMKATADIPFEFFTSDSKMPAGEYEIRTVGPTHLLIRNRKDPKIVAEMFTSPAEGAPVEKKDAKLIFVQRDQQHYLVGLVNTEGRQRVTAVYGASLKATDVRKEVVLTYK